MPRTMTFSFLVPLMVLRPIDCRRKEVESERKADIIDCFCRTRHWSRSRQWQSVVIARHIWRGGSPRALASLCEKWMTVAFADIEDKFNRVFGFIRRDLEQILTLDPGGNFAVAVLVTCACETLARYRYGHGEGADTFSRLLPSGPFQRIAKTLYNVLRNGFVHRYDAADIRVSGTILRLAVSWREHQHLSVKEIEGVPNLVLNVTQLCRDLFSSFDDYRAELEKSGEARDRFFTTYRQVGTIDVTSPGEIAAWREVVKIEST